MYARKRCGRIVRWAAAAVLLVDVLVLVDVVDVSVVPVVPVCEGEGDGNVDE